MNLFWGLIVLGIILDALLVWAFRKHFKQRGIANDLKSHVRYMMMEFPIWLAGELRERTFFFVRHIPVFFQLSLNSMTLILVLALVPPLLVLQMRWFNMRSLLQAVKWFGNQTVLVPEHFPLILFSMALAVWFIVRCRTGTLYAGVPSDQDYHQERQLVWQRWLGASLIYFSLLGVGLIFVTSLAMGHTPGWDLTGVLGLYVLGWGCWDFPFQRAFAGLRVYWKPCLAMLLAHMGLILFLYNTFGRVERFWVFDVLTLATGIFLVWNWRAIPAIYWIVSFALVLFTWNINAWWFSVIGDEYNFFTYAREIIQQHTGQFIGEHLFYGQSVYGTHPYFSSLIQAVFIRLFGAMNFGWRFSNLYLSAMAIGFFYLFFKAFTSRQIALFASLFLAGSQYLMTFGKIGYNNLQAFFALGLVMWLARRTAQFQSLSTFVMLGLGLGGCFYVYPAALYIVPLPLLLLFFYVPPKSKAAVWGWVMMTFSWLIVIYPLFLQPAYWQTKMTGTFFNAASLTSTTTAFVGHWVINLFYAFFSFLYLPNETHFVVSSYVDPITAALWLIGGVILLRQIKVRFNAFLLISFLFLLVAVGASHDRDFPPTTRMFLLLPWYAIIAAIGLVWLLQQLKETRQPVRLISLSLILFFVAMFISNIYMAYDLAFHRSERYQVLESLYLKIAQRSATFPQTLTTVFICGESWGVAGIQYLQNIYGVPASEEQIMRVVVKDGQLPSESYALLESPYTIAILAHGLKAEWMDGLGAQLAEVQKSSCKIKSSNGTPRFELWYSGALSFLCE